LRRYRESSGYQGRFGPGQVREDLLALVVWILEGDGRKRLRYPFALPHLDLVRRARDAGQRAKVWIPFPRTEPERRALRHLEGLVARPVRDRRHAELGQRLEQAWQAFVELRGVLRLSNVELPGGDRRMQQGQRPDVELRRLQGIDKAVKRYREELRQRIADGGKRRPDVKPYVVIHDYLQCYGDRLFGHPILRDEDGAVLAVVERTNNTAEHFFGVGKQGLRRRVGRASLGRDMEQQPAQAAYVSNLRHPDYVRVLCGSLDNLPAAFAELDADKPTPVILLRENRDSHLFRRVRALLGEDGPNGNGRQNTESQPLRITPPTVS